MERRRYVAPFTTTDGAASQFRGAFGRRIKVKPNKGFGEIALNPFFICSRWRNHRERWPNNHKNKKTKDDGRIK